MIGIGTRYSATSRRPRRPRSRIPSVRFININVAEFDAFKHAAMPLVGDARVDARGADAALGGYRRRRPSTRAHRRACTASGTREVDRLYSLAWRRRSARARSSARSTTRPRPQDVVVCAAGSLPGDLHKLWRTRDPKGYHLEYGYSCMGYEIAGGLGVKMADPDREVYVMVGDGSYLMMAQEIVTSVQEGFKLIIVLRGQPRLCQHRRALAGRWAQKGSAPATGTAIRPPGVSTALCFR